MYGEVQKYGKSESEMERTSNKMTLVVVVLVLLTTDTGIDEFLRANQMLKRRVDDVIV